jgi:cyanophycinase
MSKALIISLFFIFTPITSFASTERLLLIGGGDRPEKALKWFVNQAGKEKAKIVIIPWASGYPDEAFKSVKEDFEKITNATLMNANKLLNQKSLQRIADPFPGVTAFFFTGGSQNKLMKKIKSLGLVGYFKAKYSKGVVFGGTSAGTAIMSEAMLTGVADNQKINTKAVEVVKGLGLLKNTLVDQHFIRRNRQTRMLSALLKLKTYKGIGIDEDTALTFINGKPDQVFGKGAVIYFGIALEK